MFYYKIEENGEVVSVEARSSKSTDTSMAEITEDEYLALSEEIKSQYEDSIQEIIGEEQSKDERIAELEAENAALLYQVLTGEELTDV